MYKAEQVKEGRPRAAAQARAGLSLLLLAAGAALAILRGLQFPAERSAPGSGGCGVIRCSPWRIGHRRDGSFSLLQRFLRHYGVLRVEPDKPETPVQRRFLQDAIAVLKDQ